jgi:PIN domain nuclease of toxin-antitoxin system
LGVLEVIVLDTHAWIWWLAEPERLSPRARDLVEKAAAEGEVYVSSITFPPSVPGKSPCS